MIKGYTKKQWGRPCNQLPSFIIKRLPVRFTFDNNYFNALFQGIPIGGYTKMVEKYVRWHGSAVRVDYLQNKEQYDSIAAKIVYTGAIDAYFDYKLGALEYRSVRFDTQVLDMPNFQGNAAVNYTDEETSWTRIIEHKWFEFGKDEQGNELPKTVISKGNIVQNGNKAMSHIILLMMKNSKLYLNIKNLADKENNVIFGGRLGRI